MIIRHSIAAVAFAVFFSVPADAQTQQSSPVSAPPATQRSPKPTSAELSNRTRGHVWVHMHRREFDLMEQWAADLRDPERAETDGKTYAFNYYKSFWINANPAEYDEILKRWMPIFNDWKARYPQSPTPHLVHAALLTSYADYIRGEDWIGNLSPDRRSAANLAYRDAYRALTRDEGAAELMRADYAWWEMTFMTGLKAGVNRAKLFADLAEGVQRFPYIPTLQTVGSYFNVPRWGGSYEEFNAWVEASVKATQAKYGLEMYARIYMTNYWDRPLQKLLRTQPRHWQLVKAGLAEIAKRQPNVMDHEGFVSMACGARDKTAFKHYWAAWRAASPSLYEEPPMDEYCAFDEQDDRDADTPENVPLPNVM